MADACQSESFLRRHWPIVGVILLVAASVLILVGLLINPLIVERYVSSDGVLEAKTKQLLWAVEGVMFVSGFVLLMTAWRMKDHTARKQRVVIRCGILLASILVMFVFFEVALGVMNAYIRPVNRQRHYFLIHDAQLGWRNRPGASCQFKGHSVEINSHGHRDFEFPREKPPGEFRVLMLGDSQIFGDGIAREETLAANLETELNDVEVLNASVIGYGTDQRLIYMREEGHRFQPDITLLTIDAYDFYDNSSRRVRSGYGKPMFILQDDKLVLTGVPIPKPDLFERVDRWLQQASSLYHVGRNLRTRLPQADDAPRPEGDQDLSQFQIYPKPQKMAEAQAVTLRLVEEIADESEAVGSRTVLVWLPYMMDLEGNSERNPEHFKTTAQVLAAIRAMTQRREILFIDLRDAIAQRPPETLFRDAMHFSPSGMTVAAKYIAQQLHKTRYISDSQANKK